MTATRVTVELGEHEVATIATAPPTSDDLQLANRLCAGGDGPRIDIRWLIGGHAEIRSTSWVGAVRFSDLDIRIVPKIAGGTLGVLRMLAHTMAPGLLRRIADQDLPNHGPHLFDILCDLLAEETERVVRHGLVRDYRPVNASLEVLRGRLRHREQALNRFGRLDRLECTFDEHDADIAENQFLTAALGSARNRITDPATRRRVHHLCHVLDGASTAPSLDPTWYRNRIRYDRRNNHYRNAHHLADLVLRQIAFDDAHRPSRELHAFLIDMNRLVEAFLGRVLTDATENTDLRVDSQHALSTVIRNDRTGRPYATIRPDLVITDRRTGRRVPIDVKYKLYDHRRISTSDLYQAFTYAHALRGPHEAAHSVLLYPTAGSAPGRLISIDHRISIDPIAGGSAAKVTGVGIDLVETLHLLDGDETDRATCHDHLRHLLHTVVDEQH